MVSEVESEVLTIIIDIIDLVITSIQFFLSPFSSKYPRCSHVLYIVFSASFCRSTSLLSQVPSSSTRKLCIIHCHIKGLWLYKCSTILVIISLFVLVFGKRLLLFQYTFVFLCQHKFYLFISLAMFSSFAPVILEQWSISKTKEIFDEGQLPTAHSSDGCHFIFFLLCFFFFFSTQREFFDFDRKRFDVSCHSHSYRLCSRPPFL